MRAIRHWTSAELAHFPPDDGKRYEIIDGELSVHQPTVGHQIVGFRVAAALDRWNSANHPGEVVLAPGVIFDEHNDVAPDVIWISTARLAVGLDKAGHVQTTPELIVEVLSPGVSNARRDRVAKLELYAQRGVGEYWIADWRQRQIQIYEHNGTRLEVIRTLTEDDVLTSPLLPDFQLSIRDLFANVPVGLEEGVGE